MTEEIKNKDYLIFVLSKAKEDLCQNDNGVDLEMVCSLLSKLEKSDNPEREIFLLTRVEGFESLGSYLLFIMKKVETGAINFENFIRNLQEDKNYIIKELINSFRIDRLVPEPESKEKQKNKEVKKITFKT